tara:strand:- start:4040 stop:4240 length:201 start_codon:yes stop_codon:yes gene_type:complete
MNIEQIDVFLNLWDKNELKKLWNNLSQLSSVELAFVTAWMTTMIRDDGEIRLSQWLVWLETKAKNK